ncbi:MAG: hypothetical protein ACKUBY_03310 [Candidatus Moraniibacteriota bacterium]|jgi:hypothetical protein
MANLTQNKLSTKVGGVIMSYTFKRLSIMLGSICISLGIVFYLTHSDEPPRIMESGKYTSERWLSWSEHAYYTRDADGEMCDILLFNYTFTHKLYHYYDEDCDGTADFVDDTRQVTLEDGSVALIDIKVPHYTAGRTIEFHRMNNAFISFRREYDAVLKGI